MTHDVGFTIGDGSSNVMNDFIELRSIDKILKETCRKPFSEIPCAFNVIALKSKLRDFQSDIGFHNKKIKMLAEKEMSALCFLKENPDLANRGDMIFEAIERQNEVTKKVDLSSSNTPSL